MSSATTRRSVTIAVAVVLAVVAGASLAARTPRGRRLEAAALARWREMHTPGGGRARALAPEVLALVQSMQQHGVRTYRFTPHLGDDITISPFIVEASWPIEVRLEDETVAGYAGDFAARPDCAVTATVGKLALAHCHL